MVYNRFVLKYSWYTAMNIITFDTTKLVPKVKYSISKLNANFIYLFATPVE